MNKTLLLLTLWPFLLLTGCGLFGGDEPTPPPEVTPTPVVLDIPTPTPLPVEAPPGEALVSLLDTAAPPLNEPALPAADTTAPPVQLPRFSAAGAFSFVPPAGWTVAGLGRGVHLVQRAGDDLYTGATNVKPYIYLKTGPAIGRDEAALQTALDSLILANLAGAQTTEPPQGVVIDGVTGVWQFANGRNDTGQFRAYLLAIPAGGETTLTAVIWAAAADWPVVAPDMAKVLETMRFPEG